MGWLELFSGLALEVPRDLGGVAGVVGVVGSGGGSCAAEVAPVEGVTSGKMPTGAPQVAQSGMGSSSSGSSGAWATAVKAISKASESIWAQCGPTRPIRHRDKASFRHFPRLSGVATQPYLAHKAVPPRGLHARQAGPGSGCCGSDTCHRLPPRKPVRRGLPHRLSR